MRPYLYHNHHQKYTDDIPYWLRLAKRSNGSVLELGCGTGRVTRPLAEAGFDVTGIDLDPEMLAHPNLADLPNTILLQEDMTNFNLGKKFNLILLPCNTYSTFDAKSRVKILTCVRGHLVPGGIFAASLPNPLLLQEIDDEGDPEEEAIFPHPETGNPVLVHSSWLKEKTQIKIIWDYDHLLPEGQVERNTISTTHYPEEPEGLEKEITNRGFAITTYGDFMGGEFTEDSDYLIIEARLGSS